MSSSITNRQLAFMLFLTLTQYSVVNISKSLAESAGTGSWVTIIITAIIFAIVAVIIVSLNNMFKGKMLFDYGQELIGKVGTYAVSIFYILFFFVACVFVVLNLSEILKANFLLKTPKGVTIFFSIPIFCFLAYKGITTIARMCEIIGLLVVIIGTFVHVSMISKGQIENILPLFNMQDVSKYLGAVKEAFVPFLGIEFILVIPFTKKNVKKSKKTAFFTVLLIGLFYILVVESCIMKIGLNSILHYEDALIVAIRDTEIEFLDFLKRLDVTYLTFGFMGFFMGLGILYLGVIELLCKIFHKLRRLTIVLIVGITSFLCCIFIMGIEGYNDFLNTIIGFIGIATSLLIPTLLLIIAKAKKRLRISESKR